MAELSADFDRHVAETEESNGHARGTCVATAPRLSNLVRQFINDHATITGSIGDLLARASPPMAADEVDAVRELGTALLGRLARHRQHGADLIYEAYQVDLGGET